MNAKEISVSVVDFGGEELFVHVTFKLKGHLERDETGQRVREGTRKAKSKEIRKILEGVEFTNE